MEKHNKLPLPQNANYKIFDNANRLRKKMTATEKILWNELRGDKRMVIEGLRING